jgi:glycosyltransferase involved in cell wall biosynthesis
MTLVSVIIPTKDRPEALSAAINSVAHQDVPAEIIVVNDGGKPIPKPVTGADRDLPIAVVSLDSGSGPSAARNAGLKFARGDYVSFLDDDDVYLRDHLRRALTTLHDHGADMAYASCLVSDKRIDPQDQEYSSQEVIDLAFDQDALGSINFMPTSAVVCRNIGRLGIGFDEELRVCEDWELWLRLTRQHRFKAVHVARFGIGFHRLFPDTSMTMSSASELEVQQLYSRCRAKILTRYPARNMAENRARQLMDLHYRHVFELLRSGRGLHPYYYERTIRLVYRAAHESTSISDYSNSIRDCLLADKSK